MSDVLAAQPDWIQNFLLRTSVLSQLTGSLCDAVTGSTGSDRILEQLEGSGIFLVRFGEADEWYRYHTLFAEAMQYEATLGKQKVTYTVSNINFNLVPAAKFDLPKSGYRVMTYEESKTGSN